MYTGKVDSAHLAMLLLCDDIRNFRVNLSELGVWGEHLLLSYTFGGSIVEIQHSRCHEETDDIGLAYPNAERSCLATPPSSCLIKLTFSLGYIPKTVARKRV
jgi:hypothetical protein